MSQQVIIFDTTLRDGEQALQASLSVKEKLQIAMALERMGVDVMEDGFPVSSPVDFESVQTIARNIKNSRVCGLARCVDKDIDVIYRPREEKEENLRYKEERKKAEKEAEKMEKHISKFSNNILS